MNRYWCFLKFGDDSSPDIQDYCKADSKEQAQDIFYKRLAPYGYSKEVIDRSVVAEKEMAHD